MSSAFACLRVFLSSPAIYSFQHPTASNNQQTECASRTTCKKDRNNHNSHWITLMRLQFSTCKVSRLCTFFCIMLTELTIIVVSSYNATLHNTNRHQVYYRILILGGLYLFYRSPSRIRHTIVTDGTYVKCHLRTREKLSRVNGGGAGGDN